MCLEELCNWKNSFPNRSHEAQYSPRLLFSLTMWQVTNQCKLWACPFEFIWFCSLWPVAPCYLTPAKALYTCCWETARKIQAHGAGHMLSWYVMALLSTVRSTSPFCAKGHSVKHILFLNSPQSCDFKLFWINIHILCWPILLKVALRVAAFSAPSKGGGACCTWCWPKYDISHFVHYVSKLWVRKTVDNPENIEAAVGVHCWLGHILYWSSGRLA